MQTGVSRVLLATWDDEPPLGGQGVYLSHLRRELSARGLNVATVAGRGEHRVDHQRWTGRAHLDMSIALNRSPACLVASDPDVVHVNGGPGGLALLRRLEVPVVYTAHHTHRQASGWRGIRIAFAAIEARAYTLASRVIAVSQSTADALLSIGVEPGRIDVVPPGIDLPEPIAGSGERCPGRMLFVGRFCKEKGMLDALVAMEQVCARVPGTSGHVVGEGLLRHRAEAIAARSAGRISVVGRVSGEKLAAEYREAEVVMVPSSYEGLGMVALEAMASGAAVVAYDVDGLRDAVGSLGVLVAPGRVDKLAEACIALLSDTSYREEMGVSAARAVRHKYSWDRCADDVIEIYRAVCTERLTHSVS